MKNTINDSKFLALICVMIGHNAKELIEKNNQERISEVRHAIIYFLHIDFEWKKTRISKALNRHHASVFNSIDRYKSLVDSSPEFREMVARYRDDIADGLLALEAIS